MAVSFEKWADSIIQVAFPPKCKGAAEDLLKDSTASQRPYCKHRCSQVVAASQKSPKKDPKVAKQGHPLISGKSSLVTYVH